jgi:GST-like protein
LQRGKHPFQLYSLATPNGVKVTILLEELCEAYPDFDYDAWLVKIDGDQFSSGFVEANPNSKIPAALDYGSSEAGEEPTRLFESASIMMYLCEKYDKKGLFMPADRRAEILNWLFWQMGSAPFLGGGFGHFYNYAPVKIEYAIDRYAMEAKRQLDVLNRRLGGMDGGPFSGGPYICGDKMTVADMAIWPWYGNVCLGRLYGAADVFLNVKEEYPFVCEWAQRMAAKDTVKRGRLVNRSFGPDEEQLHDRHSRGDFDTQTQDKLKAAAAAEKEK